MPLDAGSCSVQRGCQFCMARLPAQPRGRNAQVKAAGCRWTSTATSARVPCTIADISRTPAKQERLSPAAHLAAHESWTAH
jgi:hypothetical protein